MASSGNPTRIHTILHSGTQIMLSMHLFYVYEPGDVSIIGNHDAIHNTTWVGRNATAKLRP